MITSDNPVWSYKSRIKYLNQDFKNQGVTMPESTKIQRLELNHKVVGRVYIHIQVQFHWNEKLPICWWVYIGQVRDFVMKLNLGQSLQDFIIFGFNQFD